MSEENVSAPGWISVEDSKPAVGAGLVLIAYMDRAKHCVTMGWYAHAKTLDAQDFDDAIDSEYDEDTDTYWMVEGWVDESRESECHYSLSGVTHWMPLPAPPNA